MGITISSRGSLQNTERFFKNVGRLNRIKLNILHKYGSEGVVALSSSTPVDTGKTASSWGYEITNTKGSVGITWYNTNMSNNIPIVVLLHYGHATKSGRYIKGIDFINPSLKPIFTKISEELWKEVIK